MEYILTKSGQARVWGLVKTFLRQKQIELPQEMTIGLILGCALIHPEGPKGKNTPGASRLTEITIREGTALIWQIRNEHVIKHNNDLSKLPTNEEIEKRFIFQMNCRMQLDCTLTNRVRFGKKADMPIFQPRLKPHRNYNPTFLFISYIGYQGL